MYHHIIILWLLSDDRFGSFFIGDNFSEVHLENGLQATYHKDSNYDAIMKDILASSTSYYRRSINYDRCRF